MKHAKKKTSEVPKMRFFTYNQNNSGGSFAFDKKAGISHIVIIEAENASAADAKAERIGLYFDGVASRQDCECCGDRWDTSYGKGDDVPSIYGRPVEKYSGRWMKKQGPEAYVHYADGTIKEFCND